MKTVFLLWGLVASSLVFATSCGLRNEIRREAMSPAQVDTGYYAPSLPVRGNFVYWNLKSSIRINVYGRFRANRLPEFYSHLLDGNQELPLHTEVIYETPTNIVIEIRYPEKALYPQKEKFYVRIVSPNVETVILPQRRGEAEINAAEYSEMWLTIKPDYLPPYTSIVAHSPSITRGGSALVIFEARDEKIESVEIVDNRGKIFVPKPFVKDGYYASLIGWYIAHEEFQAWIIARDQAGNVSSNRIHIETRPRELRELNYRFSRAYPGGPIGSLRIEDQNMSTDPVNNHIIRANEREWFLNNRTRGRNISMSWLASFPPQSVMTNYNIGAFDPLGQYRITAEFGQIRNYHYRGGVVRRAYHLGKDMSYYQKMPITNSNPGVVLFAAPNGAYGNTVLIDHGFGLHSLHSHCSDMYVRPGDIVGEGYFIARTGTTGLVTGDHLHFGMLVQGVYIAPSEWMDNEWINRNISQVIELAHRALFLRPDD